MKETKFIEQNKAKWREFEKIISTKEKDPEKLSRLFVQITDDLSYARTFYTNRSVRVYLNNLSQKVFYFLYKTKKNNWVKFAQFWTEELPSIVYYSRKQLLLSLVVFVFFAAIGVLSSMYDPDFAEVILGKSYVEMTKQNIANGDPMAVYKDMHEVDMFLGITINNIRVSFLTFLSGLIFSIGSLGIMLYNGIMVGAFQYFFIERGLFWESFLTIWLHGTLEISSIILAGGAGMVLGSGLVFTGTYSRSQSFQVSAKKGLKLLLGLVPLFIIAGFVEGFFTRATEAPDILRLGFILLSLFFIIGYFVVYPYLLKKRGKLKKLDYEQELITQREIQIIQPKVIQSSSRLVANIFFGVKQHVKRVTQASILLIASYLLVFFFVTQYLNIELWASSVFDIILDILGYDLNSGTYGYIIMFLNVFFVAIFTFLLTKNLVKEDGKSIISNKKNALVFVNTLIFSIVFNTIFFAEHIFFVLIFFFATPLCFLWYFISAKEDVNLIVALQRLFQVLKGNFYRLYELFFLVLAVVVIFVVFVNSPFLALYTDILSVNFVDAEFISHSSSTFIYLGIGLLCCCIALIFFTFSIAFTYYSFQEISGASGLKEEIENTFS